MKYIIKVFVMFALFSVPLYSYEFIGHYLDGHNAIGWSVVDETESKGYYVVLTGECLSVGYYGYCTSYDYGILRVDKRGNEVDYRVIYHYEYSDREGEKDSMISRENSHMGVKGATKERSEDGGGRITVLRGGRYSIVVDRLTNAGPSGYYGIPHVMVLNDSFEVVWEEDINLSTDASTSPAGIIETEDGNILMYYEKYPDCTEGRTIKLERNDGREIWRTNGSNDVKEITGGYIRTRGNQISMIDKNGDSVWTKTYTADSEVDPYHTLALQGIDIGIGGGYISAGRYEVNPETFTGYVVRVDDSGGVIWKREYPGWFWVQGIFNVGDGYVIVGSYREPTYTPIYTFILKIDTIGNIVWKRDYRDSTTIVLMNDARRTVDGGYIMTGEYTTESLYIIKTNNLGLVDGVGEGNRFRPTLSNIDYIIRSRRELAQLFKGNPGIKIYDLSGREITSKPTYFKLKRGIYLYKDKRSKKRGLIMLLK